MPRLAVFTSHSGKTVELEVGPHARVEAVQQTLAGLTGIPQADQILMCEGVRLDGAKPLASYGLPREEPDKVHDVFLYSRAHLHPDAPLPPPETLPECPLDLSGLDEIQRQRHPLDSAGSPLLRLLPDYQRQFQQHLLQANARHQASQQRMSTCAQLVSEQEVQALSIDAATSNVELHYAYICDAFSTFMHKYQQQHGAHAEVLSRFEADLQYLAATELHPSLRVGQGTGGAPAQSTLLHLVNADQLREAAAGCLRGHQHFGAKVSELEGLFGMLKADVEALFMQAPSVDLEALTRQLEDMHRQVDEQASIVAALSSDLGKVQQLVEQASQQLAADPAASVQVSDTVHMLETMRETHVGHLLPRVQACHEGVEGFAAQCLDCKNALTRDVFSQLRTISSQQSKIREMKNKLALFREALARQDAAVQELLVVRRVPAAYKQCLAECVRREAFIQKYAHSAAQLAERMGSFREKELAMRDAFRKHVERLIPTHLLERMGLLEQPPHCQVSVSAAEGEQLLGVTVDDVRRIQLPWGTASALGTLPSPVSAGAAGGTPGRERSGQPTAAAGAEQQQEEAAAASAADVDATATLQLENAKLRAELASQIALDCIRAAQLAGLAGAAAPATRPGSGQASPQVSLSTASSPRTVPASVAASGAALSTGAVPAEAVQHFERALAAKDGLVAELQAQLGRARQQAATYEERIQQLEVQLTTVAAAAEGKSGSAALAPILLASSGSQAAPLAGASSTAGSSMQHSGPLAGTIAGGSSVASSPAAVGAVVSASLPASPSATQTSAAAAAGLSSSIDAAAGSSLSGSLHTPYASRSLGVTTSLPASQPGQQMHAAPGWQPADVAPAQAAGTEAQPLLSTSLLGVAGDTAMADEAASPSMHASSAAVSQAAAAELSAPAAVVPALAASAGQPAGAEPVSEEGSQLEAAPAAVPAPPPAQLLASAVADEGSDVEGIEPVEDSSSDDEEAAGASQAAGYESASEQPASGEQ